MKGARNRLLLVASLTVALLALWLGAHGWEEKRRSVVTPELQAEKKNSTPVTLVASTISPRPSRQATAAAQEQAFITAFNTPIAFYGRVIDQYGDSIPEADVKFQRTTKHLERVRPTIVTKPTPAGDSRSTALQNHPRS
jgi:hypothetical protein